ncbi:hypothetical protein pEaSNUABM11_00202 [Erwinia phage pEa_SNUABM_11]|nr:hypothetical protein pEaSNUABM11_00202 [Erwinia phage pEa_SNUABM_11]
MKVTAFLAAAGKLETLPEQSPSFKLVKDAPVLKAFIDSERGESSDPVTIFETEVEIKNLWVNLRKGNYIKLQQVEDLMGRDFAIRFAVRNEHQIQKTEQYKKVRELNPGITMRGYLRHTVPVLPDVYLQPETVFANKEIVAKLVKEGYDGASTLGLGAFEATPQYFAFSAEQLKVRRTQTV